MKVPRNFEPIVPQDGSVTNTKLADMATKTYKGRTSAATGVPEDVVVATLKADLVLVKADVGLGSVENTALSTWAGSTNITTLGAVTAPSVTTPLVIGGTAVGSKVTYKSTTGAGTVTGIAHQFVGGTNGATVAATILNDGKVGIGTTGPRSELDVAGATGLTHIVNNMVGQVTIGNANNNAGSSLFVNTPSLNTSFASGLGVDGTYSNPGGVGISVVNLKAHGVRSGGGYGSNLAFWTETGANGSEPTEKMRILSNGNVGIGTTTGLTAKLNLVAGTASVAPLLFNSGTLLTTPLAGSVEFLTDAYYGTITTGAVRKQFAITGYTTAPSAITVGASPFVYQNTSGYPAQIICSGGTVTEIAISRDGTTYYVTGLIAGATVLGPGDRVKVTYAAAPTMTHFPL
jgi:hypothetical protein